jgi:hypothetical protein
MQYFDWNKQCPYAALYSQGYPAANRQYNNSMLWGDDFYDNYNEIDYRYLQDFDEYSEVRDLDDLQGLSRAQKDIERVIPIVFQRAANEINQAIALGMKPNLVGYLIREMVEYIDRNYDQYGKSASYNITEASSGIKTDLYWVLNIFRIYGLPFEVQNSLLSNTVITSMQNLRVPLGNSIAPGMR